MTIRRIAALAALTLLAACGKAPNSGSEGAASYNGEFGKAGSRDAQSCYLGELDANLRCAEAPSKDLHTLHLLKTACDKVKGKRFLASCTDENLVGICQRIKQAPTITVSYYKPWNHFDARLDCGESFNGVFKTTSSRLSDSPTETLINERGL